MGGEGGTVEEGVYQVRQIVSVLDELLCARCEGPQEVVAICTFFLYL